MDVKEIDGETLVSKIMIDDGGYDGEYPELLRRLELFEKYEQLLTGDNLHTIIEAVSQVWRDEETQTILDALRALRDNPAK